MSSLSPQPIDFYHYGNHFANAPVLNGNFMREVVDNVDRSLQVQSGAADQ